MSKQQRKPALKRNATTTAKTARKLVEHRENGVRIPIEFIVNYQENGHYFFDFSRNLSEGGIFVHTSEPREPGSTLELTFTIPNSAQTITTEGKVIWAQKPIAGRDDLIPGMGVQFTCFGGEDKSLLRQFIKQYCPAHSQSC